MLLSRATEILSILADGIDPGTGELLPEDSVCNEPEVIRAFYCILQKLECTSKTKQVNACPQNSGKPWRSCAKCMPAAAAAISCARTLGAAKAALPRGWCAWA